ncbi:MAG: fibronectin type III domain-containing protein [Candidatus Moranbacteria bacterium]|nr:fibronectin type III domain-containing protein [Candidatus Moranbacteria bacterium]
MKLKNLLIVSCLTFLFSAGVVKAEYSANIIPAMTTNILPSGVVTASTGIGSMVSTFDHFVSSWISDSGLPQWVGYQFTDINPVRVAKYAITSNGNAVNMAPKSWEFQGSINGADWVVLDSRSDVVFGDFQLQEFVVATPENYFFYKLHITAIANEFSSVGVSELEMFVDNSFVVLAPTVATVAASDVTQTSAMVNAELLDSGGENTTRLIHQWVNEPIEANLWNTDGPPGTGPVGVYSAEMNNLTPGTTYYFQAYAYNSAGSSYGEILSFTTEAVPAPPIVITNAVSDITQTSATANGDMTFRGNPFIPSRTISWGTESGNYTSSCNLGMGVEGTFSCPMVGLSPIQLILRNLMLWEVEALAMAKKSPLQLCQFQTRPVRMRQQQT